MKTCSYPHIQACVRPGYEANLLQGEGGREREEGRGRGREGEGGRGRGRGREGGRGKEGGREAVLLLYFLVNVPYKETGYQRCK